MQVASRLAAKAALESPGSPAAAASGLVANVKAFLASDRLQVLVVQGDPGGGKTTLVWRLVSWGLSSS